MPSILITRPRPAADLLAEALRQDGYEAIVEPLLSILPIASPQPHIQNIQAVMITSANALTVLEGRHQLDALINLPCYCVGAATAEKAKQFGFTQINSANSDGTALAHLITHTRNDKNRSILHICGRDIASNAHAELTQQGFTIIPWPVYAAESTQQFTRPTLDKIQNRALDAILVFSARTAETLKKLILQHNLQDFCPNMIVIGISETVTDVLKTLPWRQLIPAAAPTEDAVIACLKENLPVS